MEKMPTQIAEFIHQQHIVSLACQQNGELWCANCLYAFDEANSRLILLTDKKTKHAQFMLNNPYIAGTIAYQTENIREIEGIQFQGIAKNLDSPLAQQALEIYWKRHPIAKLRPSDVWEIQFTQIKHTTNKYLFAQKTVWQPTLQKTGES